MALLTLLVVVLIVVVIALARARSADAFRTVPVSPETASAVRAASDRTRTRTLTAIATGVLVFVAFVWLNEATPQAYGLPLLLAPGIAAATGLVAFGAFPPVRIHTETSRRQALLAPRRPWSYGPGWAYLLPLTAATATIAFTVIAGVTSTRSQDGEYRAIRVFDGTSHTTASPYPGWYYGVPLLGMTVFLAAATMFALWRISSAPAPGTGTLAEADRMLRTASARVVMKLSSGALFAYFGGVLFFAGQATRNAATFWTGASSHVVQPEGAVGLIEMITGALALLYGASLLTLSGVDAARRPFPAVTPSDPVGERTA